VNILEKRIKVEKIETIKESLEYIDLQIEIERLASRAADRNKIQFDPKNLQILNKVRMALLTALEIRDPEFTRSYYDKRYEGLEA